MHSLREVRRIETESHSGERYTVIEYQRITQHRLISSRTLRTVGGAFEWFLADGRDVNQLSPTKYQILQNDMVLNAIAPE